MLQTVDTLLRANDVIIKTVRSNSQGAAEALVQCQESAIALGTYIDTLDEKYTSLVHVLEDYCENIYQMSENLSDENLCRKVSKKIQKQLTGLQNSIKYDLPEDRKEVVFLPYKASMWDSLESVWKAADADENTDAYVIPIPYFDKNPDGTFREEHYEGDQYPAYVPVTRYDEYDLKTRRPDVIYIHNPYDECNHVTSVHPYFYSKNLRNFTDKLVYIPYFILGEIGPDNQPAIDGMKHFCFMPGTIYADQVIVQSENMRQIYINEYIKAAKEMGLSGEHVDRKSLEKKFLGTGSPKIDKVLNTRKEDLEIPAEWLRIIEKPDGSWKKIVFYNTSVSALLQHSEKMLRKMESVFEIFKENRDEVALLWRPHPLIQATIESMRPQLWEGYQEIRDRYVAEGWGIYDDTADLDRAVALSDAYYGDYSSVAQLFTLTGKETMIQHPLVIKQWGRKNSEFIWSMNCIVDEENIWFISYWYNLLCRYDLYNRCLETVRVPVNYTLEGLFGNIIKVGKQLVLVPTNANSIYVYRILEREFKEIPIREEKEKYDKFMVCAAYGETVYFFPSNYTYIIKLNLNSFQLEYLEFAHDGKKIQVNIQNYTYNQYVYLTHKEDNMVIRYNLQNETYECWRIGDKDERYSSIIRTADGKIWVANQHGKIILLDENYNIVEKISSDSIKGFGICANSIVSCFLGNAEHENSIFFFPGSANMVVEVDKYTHIIRQAGFSVAIQKETDNGYNWQGSFFSIPEGKTTQYLFNIMDRQFYSIDLANNEMQLYEIEIDNLSDNYLLDLLDEYGSGLHDEKGNAIYWESGTLYLSLEIFSRVRRKSV